MAVFGEARALQGLAQAKGMHRIEWQRKGAGLICGAWVMKRSAGAWHCIAAKSSGKASQRNAEAKAWHCWAAAWHSVVWHGHRLEWHSTGLEKTGNAGQRAGNAKFSFALRSDGEG